MTDNLYTIGLPQLRNKLPKDSILSLDDSFFIADFAVEGGSLMSSVLSHPCRSDVFMLLFCNQGRLRVNINLKDFEIEPGDMTMITTGTIMSLEAVSPGEKLHFLLVAMDKSVITELSVASKDIYTDSMAIIERPSVRLSESDLALASKYLDLVKAIFASESPSAKESILHLGSSLFSLAGGIWSRGRFEHRNVAAAEEATSGEVSRRGKFLVERFLSLVNEYHTKERMVGFYAEKLCLTPKYLSKLVKSVSGRSAPDWIDTYVILEAKNLLRNSDKTIKGIVYELNFQNQSVFYKFFKTRTGMTPSEYRKML
ncbi:MAG: AraC family transcriptional regulator [Bacteroidales bacterium]|nr:AraC family transcriptional regulator [Bacteroidales bacterium]